MDSGRGIKREDQGKYTKSYKMNYSQIACHWTPPLLVISKPKITHNPNIISSISWSLKRYVVAIRKAAMITYYQRDLKEVVNTYMRVYLLKSHGYLYLHTKEFYTG